MEPDDAIQLPRPNQMAISDGGGCMIKITLSGKLTTLFSFDGTGGTLPQAGLVRPVGADAQESSLKIS